MLYEASLVAPMLLLWDVVSPATSIVARLRIMDVYFGVRINIKKSDLKFAILSRILT